MKIICECGGRIELWPDDLHLHVKEKTQLNCSEESIQNWITRIAYYAILEKSPYKWWLVRLVVYVSLCKLRNCAKRRYGRSRCRL